MHLIGITGRARSGKDTCAIYLAENHGFLPSSFARPLKRAAREMFGLTDDEMRDEVKENVIPFWGISPRTMYQKLGTEGGRNVFGDDLWLKRWKKFYLEYGGNAHIVVSDVRFENEAKMIRDMGGIVLHLRGSPEREGQLAGAAAAHSSEAGVAVHPTDDVIMHNTGTKADLYSKLDELVFWLESPSLGGDAA